MIEAVSGKDLVVIVMNRVVAESLSSALTVFAGTAEHDELRDYERWDIGNIVSAIDGC